VSVPEQLTIDNEIDDELSFHEWMLGLPLDPGEALDAIYEITDEASRDRELRRAA
jgi:hypothetical protein